MCITLTHQHYPHCSSSFSDERECHIKPHAKIGQFNAAWLPDISACILDHNPVCKKKDKIRKSFFFISFPSHPLFFHRVTVGNDCEELSSGAPLQMRFAQHMPEWMTLMPREMSPVMFSNTEPCIYYTARCLRRKKYIWGGLASVKKKEKKKVSNPVSVLSELSA